jgi:hypothetical protein
MAAASLWRRIETTGFRVVRIGKVLSIFPPRAPSKHATLDSPERCGVNYKAINPRADVDMSIRPGRIRADLRALMDDSGLALRTYDPMPRCNG